MGKPGSGALEGGLFPSLLGETHTWLTPPWVRHRALELMLGGSPTVRVGSREKCYRDTRQVPPVTLNHDSNTLLNETWLFQADSGGSGGPKVGLNPKLGLKSGPGCATNLLLY